MLANISEAEAVEVAAVATVAHIHKKLYEGSKSYWRTRETVDVRIIEHIDAMVIEVICFEVESYQDADRLYINAEKLYKKLETPELQEKVVQKREEYARLRKRVPNEEITRSLVREAAVQYILTRLITVQTKKPKVGHVDPNISTTTGDFDGQTDTESSGADVGSMVTGESDAGISGSGANLDASTNAAAGTLSTESAGASEELAIHLDARERASIVRAAAPPKEPELAESRFNVEMAILTGDKAMTIQGRSEKVLDMLYDGQPLGIEHIVITRARKKATNKEFNQALKNLRVDSEKLNAACSDAQRKAGLAVSSVDGFKGTTVRKFDPDLMTLAQWRWIWSIRRIILQNYVAAVKIRIRWDEPNEDENNQVVSQEDAHLSPGGVKLRRMKQSQSGTKLPSLLSAKSGRHSMSSLRLITRGSREPRIMDNFSAAFSGALASHAEKNADKTARAIRNSKDNGSTLNLPAL